MLGSYAMIDPNGRAYTNISGRYVYSTRPIQEAGFDRSWGEVSEGFDDEIFDPEVANGIGGQQKTVFTFLTRSFRRGGRKMSLIRRPDPNIDHFSRWLTDTGRGQDMMFFDNVETAGKEHSLPRLSDIEFEGWLRERSSFPVKLSVFPEESTSRATKD